MVLKSGAQMQVEVLSTPELGDRTYVIHDDDVAIVVDPQRDIDRVEDLLSALGVRLSLIVETHIHNDYVSGGPALAERSGARYVISAEDLVSFRHIGLHDGQEVFAGALHVRAVRTPGHTENHLAYIVRDSRHPGEPPVVFTGGSLLFGSVGRTDLVSPERTTELTHAQYHSARHLAEMLPDETQIYPTHGFGSFCSVGSVVTAASSTIGLEKHRNDALLAADEHNFVQQLIAGLTAYPAYYAHMADRNLAGAARADLSPADVADPAELRRRLDAGEWVVDVRDRIAYAGDHVGGSVGIELGDQFATYLGWLIPWGTPLTLLGSSPAQVQAAQRQLVRIGIDRPAGAAAGPLDQTATGLARQSYQRADFEDAASEMGDGDVILDVRRADEYAAGHITGSVHLPLTELLGRLDELPPGRLWVHCASGFRASIAASLLDRAGRAVVHIDDDFSDAAPAGLVVV